MTLFTFTPPIQGDQLADEIRIATGVDLIDHYGVVGNNQVLVPDEMVDGLEVQIQGIIDAHTPDPFYFPEQREFAISEGSQTDVENIPGWASWNEDTALDWFSTNVENLISEIPDIDGLTPAQFTANAQAIMAQYQDIITAQATVIKSLARLVIALRNKTWPSLQEP